VSYGLSSLGVGGGEGISSLSSIVSYGLSSLGVGGGEGISSLSSIVSYGLSSLGGEGISSLSSIVSYGLSSLGGGGVSSLSSIVSYGLSSFSLNSIPFKSIIYNTGTNINFTNGAINPSENTVNGFTVYSCAYGNNVWVIGGDINNSTPYGLMYSLNGINWNNCLFASPFTPDYTNNIKYIESNFVGITKIGAGWFIIWSSDGINWNRNANNFVRQVFDYAYNNINNRWEFVLAATSSTTPLTSIQITSNIFVTSGNTYTNIVSGGFTNGGRAINYNNNIWVAVGINTSGFSNVQYSINGSNWSNASNVTYRSSSNILRTTGGFGGTSVVYVAPNWYVAGAGVNGTSNNPIYRSSNGINYTAIATPNTSNIDIILSLIYDSNSSQFYSLANINNLSGYTGNYLISSANNCSNWAVISPFTYSDAKQIGLAAGVITPPVKTTAVFASNIYANTVNTEYITGNGSGLVNVNLGAFSLYTLEGSNNVDNTTKTSIGNLAPGLLLANIFSNSQLIYPGKYLVNIKFFLDTISGNWSNALPYIYISKSNESLEANTYNDYAYLSRKAIYPINTAFKWHTLTDTIVTTTNASPTNRFNLYYTDQSSPGPYSMNLYFTDIIVVRIA